MLKLILVDFQHNKWLPLPCGQARTERESKTARKMRRVKERRGGLSMVFFLSLPLFHFFALTKPKMPFVGLYLLGRNQTETLCKQPTT